jgi:glyoxylase-like metal-dependent hydrolase (beta-lactamase superfamily II)
LQNFIENKGISIQNILLTHAHIDHVLGLQWAFDTYKVPVKMHQEEKKYSTEILCLQEIMALILNLLKENRIFK